MIDLQVVIPMAGRGKRFQDAGYQDPKPFIDVQGEAMITRVLNNLPVPDTVCLITLDAHSKRAQAVGNDWSGKMGVLMPHPPEVEVVPLKEVTQGAACTVLKGLEQIRDPNAPVIVANSDQYIDWSPGHFLSYCKRTGCDGAIPTFQASSPKWSYAAVRDDGRITAVAEKQLISTHATCGVYYYRTAELLVDAIDKMIGKGLRHNNEYYLAPAYNEMILDGAKILNYPVPEMFGMGTPEDLDATTKSGIFGTLAERHD